MVRLLHLGLGTAVASLHAMLNSYADSAIIRLLESLATICTEDQLITWVRYDLQGILPHKVFIGGVGRIHRGSLTPVKLISSNFPAYYLAALKRPDGLLYSPVIYNWLKTEEVQLIDPNSPDFDCSSLDAAWLKNFKASGLINVAAHGMLDYTRHYVSYFSFHQIPGLLNGFHSYRLKILVPHLNAVVLRIINNHKSHSAVVSANRTLTERELEVLTWVGEGKTSAEIASILGIARNTVRNQMQNTLIKLRVNTRSQAVAKAIKKGLITPRQQNSQFGPF